MFIVWLMRTKHSRTSPKNTFVEFTRADGAFPLRRLVVHLHAQYGIFAEGHSVAVTDDSSIQPKVG
jgi:hypothetical protein